MMVEPLVAFFAMLVAWAVIITLTLRKSPRASDRRGDTSRSTRFRGNLDGII